MINNKYAELINRDIDGMITPEEQTDLRQYLAGNAEARAYYNELVQVTEKLKAVRAANPPAELKHSVMMKISANAGKAHAGHHQDESFMDTVARWLIPSPAKWLTAGAFVGAVVMLLAINIFESVNTPITDQIGGTMLPFDTTDWQPVDRQVMPVGGTSVTFETQRHGSNVMVVVRADTPDSVPVRLTYDQDDLVVAGFEDNTGGTVDFVKAGNAVSFTSAGGQVIRIVFHDLTKAGSQIQVDLPLDRASHIGTLRTGTN